jgi:hypothetical protein
VKPLGVVAGAHNQRSSGVGSEAEESEELGTVASRSASIRSSSAVSSSSRALIR